MAKRSIPRVVRGTQKFEVVKNSTSFDGNIEVGGQKIKLKRDHAYIYDAALAKDIDQKYGHDKRGTRRKDVVVCEVPNEDPKREDGHRYSFSMHMEMPWKKKKRKKKHGY